MIKDKTNKNNLIFGNKVVEEIESGKYNSRYQHIVHPQNRGILQDSDMQSLIWDNFLKKEENVDRTLVMTRQPMLPGFVEERYAEVIFEDFNFKSLAMVTPHSMLL